MSSDDDDEEASSGDNEKEALKKLDLKVKEIMSPNPLTIPAARACYRTRLSFNPSPSAVPSFLPGLA